MKFSSNAAAALSALTCSGANACEDCTNNSTDPIGLVPAPWTLHGQVYVIPLLDLGLTGPLPTKAYSPLERSSAEFTDAGEFIAGLGNIQIIRYADSPVGPYDELLLVPGFWRYEDAEGQQQEDVRVSRIYVSQKYTCNNGRLNWNIPKHLARFDWTENEDGTTTVKVFPYDTEGDAAESKPAAQPWFQTTFSPKLGQTDPAAKPGFQTTLEKNDPLSTLLDGKVDVSFNLVQPPIPAGPGNGSYGELPGTDHWAKIVPGESADNSVSGLFDMDQGDGDVAANGTNAVGDEYYPNFWPTLPRMSPGLRMDNATITFGEATYWKA
ncbi:uncharacterized protein IWZ02DRAFT_409279 [Phyllosticta citriasiana]|uniref:uncharacterized protein n=1 Tax=Phyllosticta citriasiana TaxID=595635 RepID=UPI0030FD896C